MPRHMCACMCERPIWTVPWGTNEQTQRWAPGEGWVFGQNPWAVVTLSKESRSSRTCKQDTLPARLPALCGHRSPGGAGPQGGQRQAGSLPLLPQSPLQLWEPRDLFQRPGGATPTSPPGQEAPGHTPQGRSRIRRGPCCVSGPGAEAQHPITWLPFAHQAPQEDPG